MVLRKVGSEVDCQRLRFLDAAVVESIPLLPLSYSKKK